MAGHTVAVMGTMGTMRHLQAGVGGRVEYLVGGLVGVEDTRGMRQGGATLGIETDKEMGDAYSVTLPHHSTSVDGPAW